MTTAALALHSFAMSKPIIAGRGTSPQPRGAKVARLATQCSSCNVRELCLPCGVKDHDMALFTDLVYTRKRVKRGDSLYRAGEAFTALYAVRSGFFKTRVTFHDGRDQVTGFFMGGELLGMDGISRDQHTCDAVSLEDSEVCMIPYSRLEQVSRKVKSLQHHFHKMMSRELVRDSGVMLLLGTMRAEERLAAFLLNISQRLQSRGYSALEFNLRMTREEIGSYLGLKLETVSRLFSRFHNEGLIAVDQKYVRILDIAGLRAIYTHQPA